MSDPSRTRADLRSGESDSELATRLAVDAGQLLVRLRDEMIDRRAYVYEAMDAGDAAAQHFLAEQLARHRPGDAVLSEEGADDPSRRHADRVWIIDPLDGTREFGDGRPDWAVHIALWSRDRLIAGAVSLPDLGEVYATEPAPVLPPRRSERPRLVLSRTRTPYAAVAVAQALDADAIRMGSAGAKAMAVVRGLADVYVHDGGMHQWDSAAPAAVAAAAGLHVSRIDGSPLIYNEESSWLPDLMICRAELAEPVLRALWGDRGAPIVEPHRGD